MAKTKSAPAPANAARTQSAKPAPTRTAGQPLKYGDGSLVDGQNFTEGQTIQRSKTEKKAAPASRTILLAYYRQQEPAPRCRCWPVNGRLPAGQDACGDHYEALLRIVS